MPPLPLRGDVLEPRRFDRVKILQIVERRIPNQRLVEEKLTAVLIQKDEAISGTPRLQGRLGRGTAKWVAEHGAILSTEEMEIYFH